MDKRLLKSQGSLQHPILHILVIRALGESAKSFNLSKIFERPLKSGLFLMRIYRCKPTKPCSCNAGFDKAYRTVIRIK
jgi:hypothetical protein